MGDRRCNCTSATMKNDDMATCVEIVFIVTGFTVKCSTVKGYGVVKARPGLGKMARFQLWNV